jgi:hypothetical protein
MAWRLARTGCTSLARVSSRRATVLSRPVASSRLAGPRTWSTHVRGFASREHVEDDDDTDKQRQDAKWMDMSQLEKGKYLVSKYGMCKLGGLRQQAWRCSLASFFIDRAFLWLDALGHVQTPASGAPLHMFSRKAACSSPTF